MHNQLNKLRKNIAWILVAETIVLIFAHVLLRQPVNWLDLVLVVINLMLIVGLSELFESNLAKRNLALSQIIGEEAHQAFVFGNIGLMTYDSNLNVTWANEFLQDRFEQIIGKQVSSWIPETQPLFTSEADLVTVTLDEYTYEVRKKEDGQTLFFRDITDFYTLRELSTNQQMVIGYVHLDNYEETALYSDDKTTGQIDTNIRQRIIEWARGQGILVRRLRTNRLMLVLNQQLFEKLLRDDFSIMKIIHEEATKLDVAITLSIGFGKGSNDVQMLDEMALNALELAQSRGGDQIAIKAYDQEVEYVGGGSQAQEKRSKVRARIIAQTLKDLIHKSDNVILVGHKEMDFDCMGSALAMSNIARSNDKEAYFVIAGGIEEKLQNAFDEYRDELSQTNVFVDEDQANLLLKPKSLVVMLDHHNANQSSVPSLITKSQRVVVIDHHRRNQDFNFDPIMVYTETAASSCSELVTELIPYQPKHFDLTKEEATMILTGIIIDTNRFRNRTGSRTFEVASLLKQYGADPVKANEFLKDDLLIFEQKAKLYNNISVDEHQIAITSIQNEQISRSVMSQTADMMLAIKGVEASFVVAMDDNNNIAVSARSNGNVNVHVIMEQMNGGGHFSAAGLQRANTTVQDVLAELKEVLKKSVAKEEKNNENHSTE
ncbi:MAG: putative signal transduction phosphoesterase YybT [Erysipelotrichaceae bacterium]|nr:MAG: putative signal transduction phosphoesterase [Erysipelotrichaceae bacterium]TXT19783.1 MAG: putative signal transduction phosphoesterase YybT [Erysipelotrichaceae bacterium]